MAQPDYYRVLRVDPEAEPEIIEAAYRGLAKMYHPDVYQGFEATEGMQRINAAYEVLRDPGRRRAYDSTRSRQTSPSQQHSDSSNAKTRDRAPGQEQARPNAKYILHFGIYRGEMLQRVHLLHSDYLQSYLRTQTGDVSERNAIRRFLGIPIAHWEQDSPRGDSGPPPPQSPPQPPKPEAYVLKYGVHVGRSLADVHRDQPGFLTVYLERMSGSTDERNAIGQFLRVDPLGIRADYLRRVKFATMPVPPSQAHFQTTRIASHKRWARSIAVIGLIAFFAFLVDTGILAVPATQDTTPSKANRTSGAAATVLGGITVPVYIGPPSIPTSPSRPSPSMPTVNVPQPSQAPVPLVSGSWVARSADTGLRFFSVPWWVEKPSDAGADHFALGSVSNEDAYEAVDIYRFRGKCCGSDRTSWDTEYDKYVRPTGRVLVAAPRPQMVAGYNGNIGQFHYAPQTNYLQIDGTLWVGQVNGDRVVMVFQCVPARDEARDQAVAQVLATIDFSGT